jgi:hypothetical protein
MHTTALTAQLTDEFGYLVPASMIESTVRTVVDMSAAGRQDEVEAAETARTDVQALAEAVRRRTEGSALR